MIINLRKMNIPARIIIGRGTKIASRISLLSNISLSLIISLIINPTNRDLAVSLGQHINSSQPIGMIGTQHPLHLIALDLEIRPSLVEYDLQQTMHTMQPMKKKKPTMQTK